MTTLDFIVLGIVGFSTFLGLTRGLTREALSLAAWVLAFLLSKEIAPKIAPLLPGIDTSSLRHAAALVVVFVAILILTSLAGAVLSGLVNLAGLTAYDRILGILFGVLRGVMAVVGLTLLAGLTALPKTKAWHDAWLRPPLEAAAAKLQPWLPKDLAALIRY